ncbi:MAG: response regulator, partial [Candidatus Aenigmarchaeota archaeon]|nr:response regulator [Candidatus Aenigmarchaeota archaeon]
DIVYNGVQALKMAHDFTYDLVSMDIKMPGSNGDEAIITMEEVMPDLPVLVVSGHLNKHVRDELKHCKNVRGMMEKPVDLEKYVGSIRSIISSRKERNPRA